MLMEELITGYRSMSGSRQNSRDENDLRDLLVEFLKEPKFQRGFLAILGPNFKGKSRKPFDVTVNYRTDTHGFIDILLTRGSRAIFLELKLEAGETLHQYTVYKEALLREGFAPVHGVGIVARKAKDRGSNRVTEILRETLADARITWGQLVAELKKKLRGPLPTEFENRIRQIHGTVLDIPEGAPIANAGRRISEIENNPGTLKLFFDDFTHAIKIPAGPDKAGLAPTELRFGKQEWARWFDDDDRMRLALIVDRNRPDNRFQQFHFHFLVHIWNKRYSGCPEPLHPELVREAAVFLCERGFEIYRNGKGKWHDYISWAPPYVIGATGFFYAKAQDTSNFRIMASDAEALGWDGLIRRLVTEAQRIMATMDELVRPSADRRISE